MHSLALLLALLAPAGQPAESSLPSLSEPAPVTSALGPVDQRTMRFSFLLGRRSLDKDLWEPLDDPYVFEVVFERRSPGSILGFELGTSLAYDDTTISGFDIESRSLELYGGLRATWELAQGRLRPYLAVGPSLIHTDLSIEDGFDSDSDSDTSLGLYARAGINWVFENGFGLGLDYRKLFGTDLSLFGASGDVDFDQFGLTLGFAF
jgi:opacity protein-like surface antigen